MHGDWRANKSDVHVSQSPSLGPPAPASCPACSPIRNRNRVSARFHPGRAAVQPFPSSRILRLASPARWNAAGGENMSDSAGECARFRRYPELPVWVVEDHQEVSGRLLGAEAELREGQGGGGGASASEARGRTRICYALELHCCGEKHTTLQSN